MIPSDELRALQSAQRTLLSPPSDADDIGDWMGTVCTEMSRILRTDHVIYLEPKGFLTSAGGTTPSAEDDSDGRSRGSTSSRLSVHSSSNGADLSDGINRHFVGFEEGFSQFREAYPTIQHRVIRSAGRGAYHDAPLHDWEQRERLEIYQDVFRPVEIDRQMALSVPLPVGEAMLLAGFPHEEIPEFDGTKHQMLKLLVPAFEAGMRFRRRLGIASVRLASVLDRLDVAVLLFDRDCEEQYRNQSFRNLLPTETESTEIVRAARLLATNLAAPNGMDALPAAERTVEGASGTYTLRASPNALSMEEDGVLVTVERQDVFPAPEQLEHTVGLTPREAEVALHLARGRSNEEIAEDLFISRHTVKNHVANVLEKMGLTSRAGVALALIEVKR